MDEQWRLSWPLILYLLLNPLPQWLQTNGGVFEWISLWIRNLYIAENVRLQTEHVRSSLVKLTVNTRRLTTLGLGFIWSLVSWPFSSSLLFSLFKSSLDASGQSVKKVIRYLIRSDCFQRRNRSLANNFYNLK